jgi:hypothetical protein
MIYHNKLFVLYGEGPVDSVSGKKSGLIAPVSQLEYADLDDLMSFKSTKKKKKIVNG